MNITFKQLRVFVAIARSGTLTQAASLLFMTKGALSQTLSELENQLGVRLFERQHARLLLNHEGQRLLPVADELLTRMQGVEGLFNNGNGDTRLMVGCTKTIGSYLLPELLGAFQLRYGWLPLPIIANTQGIAGMVAGFELDVALLEGPVTDPALICQPWLEDEMVVVASLEHPLAGRGPLSYTQLSLERWLLREAGSASRAFFDHQMAPHLDNPQVGLSLDAFDAILACVKNNLGITFISRRMLEQPLYAGQFCILPCEQRFSRRFSLCLQRSKYISPTLNLWLEFCRHWSA
ncbi:LysR family transcriptional regulator [Edwardsiella ictaluri]|uniref:LysR, substrate binding domain protein n=2 Tax=Edwardsiella ictaluri TaxID=67780 RepID=C5BAN3_EDWI9|nr:LysR substrate-binding domain-containing protein [Edwardsiella ictaluri]ACR70240.1 LysR, substrate binding domain protein [Edwardsiella ictaluri 93-146]ARD39211.1 LysR family transcriptional regulator [Edwardsiella ictaluri]AVZ82886.1 LysR family transcriptional regulator [Edwardsiella ictaluri]EKS7762445.1 LysR family transcriptional regulator [Edwardsiella ictaluri]EKS7770842.1 LysR family transcriptional regulator [Edwardsiella ictaluri]